MPKIGRFPRQLIEELALGKGFNIGAEDFAARWPDRSKPEYSSSKSRRNDPSERTTRRLTHSAVTGGQMSRLRRRCRAPSTGPFFGSVSSLELVSVYHDAPGRMSLQRWWWQWRMGGQMTGRMPQGAADLGRVRAVGGQVARDTPATGTGLLRPGLPGSPARPSVPRRRSRRKPEAADARPNFMARDSRRRGRRVRFALGRRPLITGAAVTTAFAVGLLAAPVAACVSCPGQPCWNRAHLRPGHRSRGGDTCAPVPTSDALSTRKATRHSWLEE